MKLQFSNSRDDLIALYDFALRHDRASKVRAKALRRSLGNTALWAVALMLTVGGDIWYQQRNDQSISPFAWASAVVCSMLVYQWGKQFATAYRSSRSGHAALHATNKDTVHGAILEQTVEILPEHLDRNWEHGMTRYRWTGAVEGVVRTTDHIFIHFESGSALVIPRRCFSGDAEFTAFTELARTYLRAGGGPETARSLRALAVEQRLECPECGYHLTEIIGTRCPECGYQLALDDFAMPRQHGSFQLTRPKN